MKDGLKHVALKFLKLKPIYSQLPVVVGVPIIVKNSKGEILLGKRNKNMYAYPDFWNLPGGLVDYGESLSHAAKREFEEETGAKVKIIRKSKNIYEVFPTKESHFHSLNIPFFGKIIEGIPQARDETQEVRWFKPAEIKKMRLAYTHNEILKKEGVVK
jgi:8-oxo-dGTP diphosphatase